MDIDFVLTWVDMDDPTWQQQYNEYAHNKENSSNGVSVARFRDYGLLRYWFRGVEHFAPWVRKIHIVTCGQCPAWLRRDHPKVHLVSHDDIIPHAFLPTFNSGVIERYFHNIDGLAEHFVYFNDDFFIINTIPETRFFQHNLPCDIAVMQYNPAWSQWYRMLRNNISIINKHFHKSEVMARDKEKWFAKCYGTKALWNYLLTGYPKFIPLRTPHNAQPYLKETYLSVWQAANDELLATSTNRFRASSDLTHELFRTWQICSGNFVPYNTYVDTKMFPLMVRPRQAVKAIQQQRYSLICLNDNVHIRHYDEVMQSIADAFLSILPNKSTFEK